MKFKTFTLLVLLTMLLRLTACGEKAPPTNSPFKELKVPADDVTLHVRIAGDPQAGNVLIAIHGGPGMSSDYMVSLEQLASPDFIVVTYDQRSVGRSSEPSGGYALLKYVADLEAVRKAVAPKRFISWVTRGAGSLRCVMLLSIHKGYARSCSWEVARRACRQCVRGK